MPPLGSERARLIGAASDLYVTPADLPAYNALLQSANTPGEERDAEIGLLRTGLAELLVQVIVTLLPDSSGWQLILLDISQRKQLEELLRSSEAR